MTATANPVTWFEVHSADPDRAKAFYSRMFGWSYGPMMPGYAGVDLGPDAPIRGGVTAQLPGQGPMAVFVVQVPDVATTCGDVVDAGGAVALAPQAAPNGLQFAYLTDPDGSTFGIWTPPIA